MTGDEFMDLIDQMRLAVLEEAPLLQLPRGSTDDPSGRHVVHGPFEPNDCSTVLLIWFDLGWIELYLPDMPTEWALTNAEWEARTAPGPN